MTKTPERDMAEEYAFGHFLTVFPKPTETFEEVCANLLDNESEVEYGFTFQVCETYYTRWCRVNALKELANDIENLLLDHKIQLLKGIICTAKS